MAEGRILKSKYYKYPTLKEKESCRNSIPTFCDFNVPYVDEMNLVLSGKASMVEGARKNHLYHWNLHLRNRLGRLRETFWYLIIIYERGFDDVYKNCNDEEIVNKVQFSYYSEIFYYLFFSTRDVVGQFLNCLHDLKINEENLKFSNESFSKIKSESLKKSIRDFLNKTREANGYRNSFTHRFPIDVPDRRSTIEHHEDKSVMSRRTGSFKASADIMKNMTEISKALSTFLETIKNQANL